MTPREAALAQAFSQPVSGPTYRPFTRVLAVALVLGLLGWGARAVWTEGPQTLAPTHLAAAGVMAATLLWPLPMILFGRTVVDAQGLRREGWLGREIAWKQVVRARFIALPPQPRLMTSTGLGRAQTWYSGTSELDAALREAARLLNAPESSLA